jgi:hypothetical protein
VFEEPGKLRYDQLPEGRCWRHRRDRASKIIKPANALIPQLNPQLSQGGAKDYVIGVSSVHHVSTLTGRGCPCPDYNRLPQPRAAPVPRQAVKNETGNHELARASVAAMKNGHLQQGTRFPSDSWLLGKT